MHFRCAYLRLPQQAQGASMLVSQSSSWQILHSTTLLAEPPPPPPPSAPRQYSTATVSGCRSTICFSPPIAASSVDSVSSRSTSNARWSPISPCPK
uniref:Uncharacterized protein n=1 Tax=Arundo donax TaxID=35708 RepID=A0A0A9DNI8_ARUDO